MTDVDLTDLDNFAAGFPHALFETHRRAAPVRWHEPTSHTPGGVGFWSVATHAECLEVLRDPAAFSSERGGTLLQDLDASGSVLTMMDDPRHARIRRLVSAGFTPRRVAELEADLRRRSRALLAPVVDGEPVDFLTDVAAELPMQVICSLLGVPEADRHRLVEAVDPAFDVPEGDGDARLAAAPARLADAVAYAGGLMAARRAAPGDDVLSVVLHAELTDEDPPALTDVELFSFFFLLFSAGSETTRNAAAGGLLALLERPDQLTALRADPSLLPGAVEEVLRWTTPSPAQRRTATRDVELGGQPIREGDKVLVWEASANRDDRVFDRPAEFDVRRDPNPHLTFGSGVHHCLGANLARLELRVLLGEMLATFDTIELVQPVEWMRSNRHSGLRHMVVRAWRS